MEPKAKTMQERFGFSDPDLKTPKHDAIMMWLDGEMGRIVNERPEHQKGWDFHIWFEHRYQEEEYKDAAKGVLDGVKAEIIQSLGFGSTPTPKIAKVWEKPIVDKKFNFATKEFDKGFTIGFADMLVACSLPYISCKFAPGRKPKLLTKTSYDNAMSFAVPVMLRDSAPPVELDAESEKLPTLLNTEVGFLDSWRAYFEVKPSIPSVGELIRQLRMYQTYTGSTEWFVVSPDDRCESILKAQGFGFIKVPALP